MRATKTFRDKIHLKETAPAILIVVNTFVWYLLTYVIFNQIINNLNVLGTEKLGLFAAYYVGIAVTAVIGSKIFSSTRSNWLVLWLFLGVIATLLLTAFSSNNTITNFFLASFFGASIGLGLPSCLSYFANSTHIENRGLTGGVLWGIVGLTVIVFAFLISTLGVFEAILIMTVWRLFGGTSFLITNKSTKKPELMKTPGYSELIQRRELLLYLVPWVMFSLINFAESPMLAKVFGADLYAFAQLAEFAFIGVFAIIGGIVADVAGRKRVVIAGFIMIGIEYAAMSVFSGFSDAIYLFVILDGVTWGLLFSVFFTVIWGDLGGNHEKEKFYTLGGVPFLLAGFLSVLIQPYARLIPTGTAFTLASFFLFISVIPLMYAPETLPDKTIKDRELKNYLEKAQKFAQEETEKSQSKQTNSKQDKTDEPKDDNEKNQDEYDEARKLAEKYY